MKLTSNPVLLWAAGASTSLAQLLPADAQGPPSKYPIGVSKAPFPKVAGRLFEVDGKVQYFAGTNAWWLSHFSNNSDVDIALQQIIDTQYKVIRVWGFGDVNSPPAATATDPNKVYFHLLNSTGTYINYAADGLERLDYLVSAAEALLPDPSSTNSSSSGIGTRLVLPLVNYWDDLGGIRAYTTALGGDSTSWYTDPASQAAYRSYIRAVVTRYASSPAVFAWELANEARCEGCVLGTAYERVIEQWVASTAAYIKSLDPLHMVTTGEEGFFFSDDGLGEGRGVYSGVAGTSFRRNLRLADVDYGTFHLYPSWWNQPYSWGERWILEHDAVGAEVGKPVVLEEYGTPQRGDHAAAIKPWLDVVLRNTTVAADQLWQFSPANTSVPPASFRDDFAVSILDEEFEVLCRQHAANMLAKPVAKSDTEVAI